MSPGKEPRSRRVCIVCGHLHGSHIDVKCLKVICQDPHIECHCTEFVGTVEELEVQLAKLAMAIAMLAFLVGVF